MKTKFWPLVPILTVASMLFSCQKQNIPVYKNPKYTIDERIRDLLSWMTIEEKVVQTIAIWQRPGEMVRFQQILQTLM